MSDWTDAILLAVNLIQKNFFYFSTSGFLCPYIKNVTVSAKIFSILIIHMHGFLLQELLLDTILKSSTREILYEKRNARDNSQAHFPESYFQNGP